MMSPTYQFKPSQHYYPASQKMTPSKVEDTQQGLFKQSFCKFFNRLMANK